MISTNQFRNGSAIRVDGKRFTILFFQHVKPGKGGAFVRTRLRNIDSGAVVEKTFRAGEKLENVRTDSRPMTWTLTIRCPCQPNSSAKRRGI
jgi:elongation factor P